MIAIFSLSLSEPLSNVSLSLLLIKKFKCNTESSNEDLCSITSKVDVMLSRSKLEGNNEIQPESRSVFNLIVRDKGRKRNKKKSCCK